MAKSENDNADFNHRKGLWRNVMTQKMGLKQIKALNGHSNEQTNVNNYGEKLNFKKNKQNHMNSKIQNMEERELALIEKLKMTQTKQRQAYSSLENMVQVGYGYYGQCYELKRKKQNELLPIYPEMKEMSPKRKNGELGIFQGVEKKAFT